MHVYVFAIKNLEEDVNSFPVLIFLEVGRRKRERESESLGYVMIVHKHLEEASLLTLVVRL